MQPKCVCFVLDRVDIDTLYQAMADLAWWFGFEPGSLDGMTLDEVTEWQKQANRQIKAKYSKL